MVDEEDIAISAFRSFCDRAGKGQFPDLADRDHLWRVLFAITVRKAVSIGTPPDPREAGRRPGPGRIGHGGGNDPGGLGGPVPVPEP